jgi:hypothetical protein
MNSKNETPLAGGASGERDLTCGAISPANSGSSHENQQRALARQLAIFERHCRQMVERVANGSVTFISAVDVLYDAATFTGLVDVAGDDRVQEILSAAFMRGRR